MKRKTRFVWAHGKQIEVETLNPDPPSRKKRKRKPFRSHFAQLSRRWIETMRRSKMLGTYQLAHVIQLEKHKRRYIGGEASGESSGEGDVARAVRPRSMGATPRCTYATSRSTGATQGPSSFSLFLLVDIDLRHRVETMALGRRQDDDRFWQKLVLPEEDRRRLHPMMPWTGSYRWFRSSNVIDLWRHRNPVEKARICAVLLRKE